MVLVGHGGCNPPPRLDFEGQRWDGDDSVAHVGAEEMGYGRFDFFGARILIELDVVEHEAEVFFTVKGFVRSR